MHPTLTFAEPKTVARIRIPIFEIPADGFKNFRDWLFAEREFFLGHHVARVLRDILFRTAVMVRHPSEHERRSDQRITP